MSQMEPFLTALYATHHGYVAVATKERSGTWDEETFEWPKERSRLLDWAARESGRADLFICPALRKTPSRTKGDGAHLGWLWADIDMQDVPEDKRDLVTQRVTKMGTIVIKSGTPGNLHVYVRLADGPVALDVWQRLNLGLRRYLHADAKHTDNALLRIPGTPNHKPGAGMVTFATNGATTKAVRVSKLLANKVWRDVVVTDAGGANDGAYTTVDVTGIKRGLVKRMVTLPVDAAVGKYGTRHGAVFQVATWLSKRGYSRDQIHTLMADFPAGVDKEDTERGYSLHQDIARCLGQQPTVDMMGAVDHLVADAVDELEEATDEDEAADREQRLMRLAEKRAEQWDVDDLARHLRAQRSFTPPPDEVSGLMSDRMAADRPPVQFTVEEWAAVGDNVTITGQFKAGKTLFTTNLVRCLADDEPFLDRKVTRGAGRVGLWSLEMTEAGLLDEYVTPQGMVAYDNVAVLNGRGYGVNLMTAVGMTWAIQWLRRWDVTTWAIDSHARICRMAGVDENDNPTVLDLLQRLDVIKQEAGVATLFVLAHTGRGAMEEGRERARGATVLDDWADARWVLTRDGQTRFLAVEGRSTVDMEPSSLTFEADTKRMGMGGRNRSGARVDGLVEIITTVVSENPGVTQNALVKIVQERGAFAQKNRADIIEASVEAVECGFIERYRGERRAWCHRLAGNKSGTSPEQVPGISAQVVDFSGVRDTNPRERWQKRRG